MLRKHLSDLTPWANKVLFLEGLKFYAVAFF
ncbi:hypothetical protein SAMN05216534_1469 [Candidatus Aquiluna sp. UB-MaderosW2red]|nr:hypothetical protein SAMN05216534_1469 [Candidatus Aquiluna sp. UB-MaderosW2red]